MMPRRPQVDYFHPYHHTLLRQGEGTATSTLLKNFRELCLELARICLDRIVVDRIELDLVERRQAGRRPHIDAWRMMAFLGELVLDLRQQIELREQLGGIRIG